MIEPGSGNRPHRIWSITLLLLVPATHRTFGAFDAQRTGRVTLDFNQFVYATSHV